MNENEHKSSVPDSVVEAVNQHLRGIIALLDPYSTPLTAKERQKLPVMGEKTFSFVEKSFRLAEANPNLCPNFLNMMDYSIDYSDATNLRVIRNSSKQVFELIDDISLLSGSEAYKYSLAFYGYIKLLASQDVPNAKAVYEELKKRFPGRKRESKINDANSDI
ncbi:MAG: hypothetical protein LBT50_06400 [Prevotellaceae bacterium]|jgi:hypothetical protein|nr:hypothetical protein [Prevotellaceae bacterium]